MGLIGIGYGSEFHLLRMLGRHRHEFDAEVLHQLEADGVSGVRSIEWLDNPLNLKHPTKDGEWKSLDFLPDHGGTAWKQFWPDKQIGKANRDGVPSWDAVGRLHFPHRSEWLLVEAKAHEREFASSSGKCGAGEVSLRVIRPTLRDTFMYCGGNSEQWRDVEKMWLGRGYQIANRLSCLRFLVQHGQAARLLYVYFVGDSYKVCPSAATRWRDVIKPVYEKMGLPGTHILSDRVHYLFPDVRTLRSIR
jgi:hypothetical protein